MDEMSLNMVYYTNTVSYRPDKYGSETLNKEGILTFEGIDSQSPLARNIEIQKNKLESEEKYFSLGFN